MSTIAQERGEAGYALDADEGEAFWLLGMLQTIKIGKGDTAGNYGLLEIVVPEGVGSPWHVHPEEDEWFYVLEGEITFWVADTRMSLKAGSFAFGPKSVPHTFLRRSGRRESTRRLRPDAIRGIPARGRPARARARPAAACRGAAGCRTTHRNRRAQRDGRPRPARPTARTLRRRRPGNRGSRSAAQVFTKAARAEPHLVLTQHKVQFAARHQVCVDSTQTERRSPALNRE